MISSFPIPFPPKDSFIRYIILRIHDYCHYTLELTHTSNLMQFSTLKRWMESEAELFFSGNLFRFLRWTSHDRNSVHWCCLAEILFNFCSTVLQSWIGRVVKIQQKCFNAALSLLSWHCLNTDHRLWSIHFFDVSKYVLIAYISYFCGRQILKIRILFNVRCFGWNMLLLFCLWR